MNTINLPWGSSGNTLRVFEDGNCDDFWSYEITSKTYKDGHYFMISSPSYEDHPNCISQQHIRKNKINEILTETSNITLKLKKENMVNLHF